MKYYCIGIKGTGMSTLACMLYDMGNEVCGYDDAKDYKFTEEGLKRRGINIFYDGNHELDKDTIVTCSKAFSDDHKEIKRVKELGLKIVPYNEVLGSITKKFDTISVCGTHGKTTTTSILRHLLEKTVGCNYFIGDGKGHVDLKNRLLVIESDEFNRHFLAFHPKVALITCIELEHTEIYKDIDDMINTFEIFANKASIVVANGDDENIRRINFHNKAIFYGKDNNNDYVIKNIKLTEDGSSFEIYHDDEFISDFYIPLYGEHMVYNACGSVIIAMMNGLDILTIKELFKSFKNAPRRFAEDVVKDTIIVDDYAHHPTEIKVTLQAIRQKYPDKKLTVVFRPNTYSRTSFFKREFADALMTADKVYLTPIKCDRENPNDYPAIKSEDIIAMIPNSELVDEDTVSKLLKDKDGVVAFMGCATVSHLIENFKKEL